MSQELLQLRLLCLHEQVQSVQSQTVHACRSTFAVQSPQPSGRSMPPGLTALPNKATPRELSVTQRASDGNSRGQSDQQRRHTDRSAYKQSYQHGNNRESDPHWQPSNNRYAILASSAACDTNICYLGLGFRKCFQGKNPTSELIFCTTSGIHLRSLSLRWSSKEEVDLQFMVVCRWRTESKLCLIHGSNHDHCTISTVSLAFV